MRSLERIIVENNQRAIKEIKKLVKEGKSEGYISNFCEFKYQELPKEIVLAFVREYNRR